MDRELARKLIHDSLAQMMERRGSDLFVTVGFPPAVKVDGEISPLSSDPVTLDMARELVRAVMNERQTAEFDTTQECNFALAYQDLGRFRVNAFIQQMCPGLVIRKINSEVPTLDAMGLPAILKELALTKRGLIVFVGGTGTGKTTSLAALVDHRNSNSRGHIITLEDPIEFVHPHKGCIVMQREIGVDTENWTVALKNTLRQAPDVILMGEIRDAESMEHAVSFAETGHLCLATLHANSAGGALDRIVNFFPAERHQKLFGDLSSNLRAIVSQRLVPAQAGTGRVAAVEVMLNTPLMADLILKGDFSGTKELMKRSREHGMQTFDQHLFDLYEANRISYEDALRFAESSNELRLEIKLRGKRQPEEQSDCLRLSIQK